MGYLGDIGVILFSLKGHFWGQKEWFKTILSPVSVLFCCYYSSLLWPNPKRQALQECPLRAEICQVWPVGLISMNEGFV